MKPSLAADRNNDAVTLIESGNMDAAICGLSHLVEGFRNFVCESDDAYGSNSNSLRPNSLSLDQCMMVTSLSEEEEDESSAIIRSQGDSEEEEATPFVYRHGIRMPHSLAFSKDRDSLMSSIFLFNLALAHQLRAGSLTNDVPKRHLLLSKALKIYELAFKMQERGGYFNGNFLFIMAILNNIGVIHQILGSPDLAKRCFGKLMSVLMLLTERKCYDTTKIEMSGFLRNASISISKPCSAAAA